MSLRLSLVCLIACGGSAPVELELGVAKQEVVGGQPESGYPAVGFLMYGEPPVGPFCGMTVIGPKLAVSAAHCVDDTVITAVGLGEVANATPYPVRRVVMHPHYTVNATKRRFEHDLAILFLDEAPPLSEYPRIADARDAGVARYVGYGRVTPGDYDVTEGYTNERKGTDEAVLNVTDMTVRVSGLGGGLCWGDSGGPLMSPDGGQIYGVLADFVRNFTCEVGNVMLFTSLEGERAYIDRVIAEDDGGTGQIVGPDLDPPAPVVIPEEPPKGCGCSTVEAFPLVALVLCARRRSSSPPCQ